MKAKLAPQGTDIERAKWLTKAAADVGKEFVKLGYTVPETVRVSVGFPKGRHGKKPVGQCWGSQASDDGHAEIFISPELGVTNDKAKATETVLVLATLAHEIAHAIVGFEAKHGKVFTKCAYDIGLEGKPTATVAGPTFDDWARRWIDKHGTFPMGRLNKVGQVGKQTTRLIKCECLGCGYVARVTRKWIDEAGAPICPTDNEPLQCD